EPGRSMPRAGLENGKSRCRCANCCGSRCAAVRGAWLAASAAARFHSRCASAPTVAIRALPSEAHAAAACLPGRFRSFPFGSSSCQQFQPRASARHDVIVVADDPQLASEERSISFGLRARERPLASQAHVRGGAAQDLPAQLANLRILSRPSRERSRHVITQQGALHHDVGQTFAERGILAVVDVMSVPRDRTVHEDVHVIRNDDQLRDRSRERCALNVGTQLTHATHTRLMYVAVSDATGAPCWSRKSVWTTTM